MSSRSIYVRLAAMTAWPYFYDGLALAALALAVCLFYWPVLWGAAWIPRGGGDMVSFIYPMYRFAAASLRQGEIPLWNPFQYAGAPLIADNQSGIFYPFNLLLFLLNPNFSYRALELMVIAHVLLAGVGAYVCLRLLRPERPLPPGAALVGGLAFMFSDVFVLHAGNPNLVAVSAWLPLIFLCFHRALLAAQTRPRLAWILGGGGLMGVAALAGHGQMTFIIASYLGVYALYQTVTARHKWALPLLLLLGATAAATAAVTLLPSLALTPLTRRGSFDYAQSVNYSLPLQALVGLFVPHFWGRSSADFWGNWPRVEAGYLGILPLMLAAYGLRLRWNRHALFYALAGLFFLLLALGKYTPLHALIFSHAPLPFQVPARFVLLLDFSLAALAAIGVDALAQTDGQQQYRQLQGGLALGFALLSGGLAWLASTYAGSAPLSQMTRALLVFTALWLAGWLLTNRRLSQTVPAWLFTPLAAGLLALDLIGLGRAVEREVNRPTVGYEHTAAVAYLQQNAGIQRIDEATGLWQPSAAQLFGLYSAGGVFNPLEMANYAVYRDAIGYRGSPLYNLMGIQYIVAGKTEPPGDTNFIVPVYNGDPQVDIYLNTRALPRALLLYQTQIVPDAAAAFTAIHQAGFDPARTVVLEGGAPLAGAAGIGRVDFAAYGLNRVALDVQTDRPAYVLLSDVYHPAWKAIVDGQAVPILAADYAFRAVRVEAGSHHIEMTFHPPGWLPGVLLSSIAWLLLLGFGIRLLVHRRR